MNIDVCNKSFINRVAYKAYESKEIQDLPTEVLLIIFDILAEVEGLSDLQALSMVNKNMHCVAQISVNPKVQCILKKQFLDYWIQGSSCFKACTLTICEVVRAESVEPPLASQHRHSFQSHSNYHLNLGFAKNGSREIDDSLCAWSGVDGKKLISVNSRYTAIEWFAEKGRIKLIQLCLAWRGPNGERVDPTAKNNRAIWGAATNGHLDIVKLLLRWRGPNGERCSFS